MPAMRIMPSCTPNTFLGSSRLLSLSQVVQPVRSLPLKSLMTPSLGLTGLSSASNVTATHARTIPGKTEWIRFMLAPRGSLLGGDISERVKHGAGQTDETIVGRVVAQRHPARFHGDFVGWLDLLPGVFLRIVSENSRRLFDLLALEDRNGNEQ